MWVTDWRDQKLYAYALSDGDRDSDKDIDLDSFNTSPNGIWSDGTTMWVADDGNDRAYAYTLSTGDRKGTSEINSTPGNNPEPWGIWSDETTMWVTQDPLTARTPRLQGLRLQPVHQSPRQREGHQRPEWCG